MVSGTLALLKQVMIVVEGGSRAAAPKPLAKGSLTYAFNRGNFLLLHPLQPPGPYLSLEVHIPALRPKSQF